MATDTKISTKTANVEADAVGSLLNNGYLRIFGGVKPIDGDGAIADSPLATLRFAQIAFRAAVDGVISSYPIAPDMNTAGTGEPTWFRAFTASGEPVFDGTVGRSGCNLNIPGDAGIPLIVHAGGEFHVGVITYSIRRML